jgi:hypothetical protein
LLRNILRDASNHWKAVFAALSPSTVFEAIAEFAELRADQRRRSLLKEIDDPCGFPVVNADAANGERHRSARELISFG